MLDIHRYGKADPSLFDDSIPEPNYKGVEIKSFSDKFRYSDIELERFYIEETERVCQIFNQSLLPQIIKEIYSRCRIYKNSNNIINPHLADEITEAITSNDFSAFNISSKMFTYEFSISSKRMACFISNKHFSVPRRTMSFKEAIEGENKVYHMRFRCSLAHFRLDFHNFMFDTLRHELAHALVYIYYSGLERAVTGVNRNVLPHGAEWKRVVSFLGANPKATHKTDIEDLPTYRKELNSIIAQYHSQGRRKTGNHDTTVRRKKRYVYGCKCNPDAHLVTKNKHDKMMSGMSYICRKCKGRLVYTGKTKMVY